MDLKCHLALTGFEHTAAKQLPKHIAWMACHFSLSSKGLSNLPADLPAGAVVLIDDSIPPLDHDPEFILQQLNALIRQQKTGCILLDLQRPDLPENAAIAKHLTEKLDIPVCVSSLYAGPLACSVLLPPPPLTQHLKTHISPWGGRDIWLEIALESQQITVTQEGSHFSPLPFAPLQGKSFTDEKLCTRYQTQVFEDRAVFTLVRDVEMNKLLLQRARQLRIAQAVGLYQQFAPVMSEWSQM